MELWKKPAGVSAVFFIFTPENFGHHPLLPTHAREIEQRKWKQTGESRDVVRQDHGLRDDHEPDRQIHGMADAPIDSLRDQFVSLKNLERGRPVRPEIAMRPPENPVASEQDGHARQSNPQRDAIIRKREERRDDIQQYDEGTPGAHSEKLNGVRAGPGVTANGGASMRFDIRRANHDIGDPIPEDPDHFGNKRVHSQEARLPVASMSKCVMRPF